MSFDLIIGINLVVSILFVLYFHFQDYSKVENRLTSFPEQWQDSSLQVATVL